MKIIKKQGSEFPGYKKVDYIQFNGTQQIDTGVYPDDTTKVQCKFVMTNYNGGCFIGGDTDSDSDNFRFFISGSTTYLDYGNGYGNRISGTYITSTTTIYETEFGNRYVKDLTTGTTKFSGGTVTLSERTYTIKICKNSDYGKIYYCKIYKGGILVRDYIPVLSNSTNTVGLLDKVNMVFYTDVNNNSFTYGQIIDEEDKYYCIKSSDNILYQPKLDGTEAITTMSGQTTPTISNNTLVGGSGYLTQGWDNTGLWKLQFEATADANSGNGIMLHAGTTNTRDYDLVCLTGDSAVYIYSNGSTTTVDDRYFPNQSSQNKLDSGWKTVEIEKISSNQIKITINGYSKTWTFPAMATYNIMQIGVDSWGGTAQLKNIVVTNGDTITKYYGINSNILYQPKLDGSEAIITMSGQNSPTIVNNTFTGYTSSGKGGSGYLSEGWDNTGLWQLTFKGRILDYTGNGLLLVCNSTQRDYNLINMTAEDHWRYNGSSSTKFSYSPSLYNSTMRNVTITKINSTTITIKVDTGSEVTIDGFTALSQTDRCYIGVDSWENGKYGVISDILVIKK